MDSETTFRELKDKPRNKKKKIILVILVLFLIAVCILAGILIACLKKDKLNSQGRYEHAAVATDNAQCSVVGRDILQKGGSAADSAVATSICLELYVGQSTGIGGGNFILYYDRNTKTHTYFDGRETAPLAATADMYTGHPENSVLGALAIGVPGTVSALWDLHQRFGKLPWQDLFQPSIELARNGFVVPANLGERIKLRAEAINTSPVFRETFSKPTGCPDEQEEDDLSECLVGSGEELKRPQLADTFERIATGGRDAFYHGELADDIVADIAEHNGIITKADLERYSTAISESPLEFTVDDWTAVSNDPPGSGAVLALILNILNGYNFTAEDISTTERSVLTYHRMIEAFKFAFAKRSALGDEDFVDVKKLVANMISQEYADDLRLEITEDRTHTYDYYHPSFLNREDHGTSHSSMVDGEGNACSITSTLNHLFGSKVMGSRTGIIFNNEMDDFSQPGAVNAYGFPSSATNFIEPGKRPQSSMSPVILTDSEGDVQMVLGASGGPRITTCVAWTILHTKWLGKALDDAIEMPRLHHQLVPTHVTYEKDFDKEIVSQLAEVKGHNMTEGDWGSMVQGIARSEDGWLLAHSDSRKGGLPAGY